MTRIAGGPRHRDPRLLHGDVVMAKHWGQFDRPDADLIAWRALTHPRAVEAMQLVEDAVLDRAEVRRLLDGSWRVAVLKG